MAEAFDYTGAVNELAAALAQLPDLAMRAAEPAMMNAVLYLHEEWPDYPPPPGPGAPSPLVTPKQRRWFFAMVRAGRIPGWRWVEGEDGRPGHPEGHYIRTGVLGQKMTERAERAGDTMLGYFGTNVPYAPWVIGPRYPGETINGRTMYQARIHEGRWPVLPEFVASKIDGAWERFGDKFFEALQEEWNNG